MGQHRILELKNVQSCDDLPKGLDEGIVACVDSAFGGGVTKEDTLGHIPGDQVLVSLRGGANSSAEETVTGFSSASIVSPGEYTKGIIPGDRALYFAATAIAQPFQGSGLYDVINKRRLEFALEQGIDTLFTRTQNPRVQEGITRAIETLMRQQRVGTFEISRTLLRGVYGKQLTTIKPTSHTLNYDELNTKQGDAYFITWRIG